MVTSQHYSSLTCEIDAKYGAGRILDEVINHTNVRYLRLNIANTSTYHFTIQRLDKDNRNVLVLETQSLQGGIITQQRKSKNNNQRQHHQQQQQQQYHPIYLNLLVSVNSFKLKWSTELDNSAIRRLVSFNRFEAINTDNGYESEQFQQTSTRFNLNSFKDILENSISDSQVILSDQKYKDYPQRMTANRDIADKSGITTALLKYLQKPILNSDLKSLYNEIPSIETLFILHFDKTIVDLGSITMFPRLERLEVRARELLNLGPPPTLKSLKLDVSIDSLADLGLTKLVSLTELRLHQHGGSVTDVGPNLLPTSLTLLSIVVVGIPPRDAFLSLTSLVTLDIRLTQNRIDQKVKEQRYIDLDSLSNLKTLKLNDRSVQTYDKDFLIEISVPPSIKILRSTCIRIPPHCTMPMLERLNVLQIALIEERISLLSLPLIKKLVILDCQEIMPSKIIIPSNVEKLTIYKHSKEYILGQVVFPPSLTHLTVFGDYEPIHLPESLVKLKKSIRTPMSFPHHLKKLVWQMGTDDYNDYSYIRDIKILVLPSNYSPHLETLDLTYIKKNTIINIPPITKYLLLYLDPTLEYYEVINQTNVRYLSIVVSENTTFEFSIQRSDADNLNVLVLETKSLQGGIITQHRKSLPLHHHHLYESNIYLHTNNDQQQKQQYDPIYLHFLFNHSSPFELKWSIDKRS
ncbi:hypothetical protein DFA_08422 [Cavenderia fasciculata]|uniref:Uncharacterized protein n=1 Tax=Cavenderia fasciculata TaxID=261658 RepID=F4Q618_CACFS|nr:uncharacterized protein DFA_08422 [Cavenderia fasciculata]EGG17427.1 hypothetical protein DFA_08422 [Cavenderia fasciculata]|eukprot:XP_004355911.1 hypothetical protein DFA_08422 [Cavenderia fasciculata]